MANDLACGLSFRLVLPLCLLAAIAFRYNGLSVVYLIYLLLMPLFSKPTDTTMKGHTGRLLTAICFTSFSFLLLQVTFQITFYYMQPNGIRTNIAATDSWLSVTDTQQQQQQQLLQVQKQVQLVQQQEQEEPEEGGSQDTTGSRTSSLHKKRFLPQEVQKTVASVDRVGQVFTGKGATSLVQKEAALSQVDSGNIIRLLSPDIGMFSAGLTVNKLCQELVKTQIFHTAHAAKEAEDKEGDEETETEESKSETEESAESDSEDEPLPKEKKPSLFQKILQFMLGLKIILGSILTTAGKVVVTGLLGLAGIILPSFTSGVYFFTFLGLCSWWAYRCSFNLLVFSSICVMMSIFSAGHLIAIYLYQLHYFQDLVAPNDIYARLFGMSAFIRINVTEPWTLHIHSGLQWPVFVNPLLLLVLYYTLVGLLRQWVQHPKQRVYKGSEIWQEFPLLNSESEKDISDNTVPMFTAVQNVTGTSGSNTPATRLLEDAKQRPNGFVLLGVFIMKQSYVSALIIMMVWSITYNSWLTFVLLIWSCVIWLLRDRRRYAMLSSPFLAVYGTLLVILNFFLGLQVTQKELFPGVPTAVLIDFDLKPYSLPFVHLGAKISYTFTFWLLLRQHVTEQQEEQKETQETLKEVNVVKRDSNQQENGVIEVIGSLMKGILVKYWIYFCCAMFFIVSFSGKVVVYKILYIMLFLFCVALYQVHYLWWRKVLKYFWMTVVSYSMVVLIAIYMYQFKTVSGLFRQILGMSEDGLRDLGLEQFDTVELFARILLPSSFLLACILQLHYFNDYFLRLTDLANVPIKQGCTTYRLNENIQRLQTRMVVGNQKRTVTNQNTLDRIDSAELDEMDEVGQQETADEPKNKWILVVDRTATLFLKSLEAINKTQMLIWRLLELHNIKIMSMWVIWITLQEVSLMNSLFLVMWVFALPFPKLQPYASSVSTVWACVMVTCKMMYQLKFVKPERYSSNCTARLHLNETQLLGDELLQKSILYTEQTDLANWCGGLVKCEDSVLPCLQNHLIILALMAFEVTVYRHQLYYRLHNQLTPPITGTLFDSITWQHLDDGLLKCIKYFINYFYYKFGLEFCFVMAVNVIGQRMDLYALVHVCWLIAVLYRRRRKSIAEVWLKYCCFIACIITLQYLLCVGIPPALCKDYPWRTAKVILNSNLIKWLYLPDFAMQPDASFIIYDYLLLLCTSLQWQVFKDENTAAVRILAGENVEISQSLDSTFLNQFVSVPNFINCRSYLDMAKMVAFRYLFWFVLSLIFVTGTTRINIFCLGYLMACFYFMLFGGSLLLRPVRHILRLWDYLIAYTVLVIAVKGALSIGACVYLDKLLKNNCWLIQTFSMVCTINGYDLLPEDGKCELPEDEAGIVWDAICFTFLLAQRRVFMSYYFLHIVDDLKASKILASRGAELIEAKVKKGITARLEEETKSIRNMKKHDGLTKKYTVFYTLRMEQIKLKQKKFQDVKSSAPTQELMTEDSDIALKNTEKDEPPQDEDENREQGNKKKWWQPWVTHSTMIRSGSYYLFETDSEDEVEDEEKEKPLKKKTAFQLAYEAWTTSSRSALKVRHKEEAAIKKMQKKKEKWEKRQQEAKAGIERIESSEDELEAPTTLEETSEEPDNVIQRLIITLKFNWVFIQAVLDDLIAALNSLCKDNLDIATVLRTERCLLGQELRKGKLVSQDSICQFYNRRLIKRASESSQDRDDVATKGAIKAYGTLSDYHKLRSVDSILSHDSSVSSCTTEVSTLCSRQNTQDDIEELFPAIPKPSDHTKKRLRRMQSFDLSSFDNGSGPSSAHTEAIEEEDEGKGDHTASQVTESDIPLSYSAVLESMEHLPSDTEEYLSPLYDERANDAGIKLSAVPQTMTASELLLNKMFQDDKLDQSDKFYQALPRPLKLAFALYNIMVSKSEMLCYFVIVLNHIVSASVITLVLPILIFLWAMLSVPRPTKRFWMTAIIYTEVSTMVTKYFCQFGFFPWTTSLYLGINAERPFAVPNIIGTEKKDGYVHFDLIQLLALFFHRSILKCHGLWDNKDVNMPDCLNRKRSKKQKKNNLNKEANYFGSEAWHSIRPQGSSKGFFRRWKSSRHSANEGESSEKEPGKRKRSRKHHQSKKEVIKEMLRKKMLKTKEATKEIALQIYLPIKQFFYDIIHPEYSPVCDVYALMFLVDFINVIIVVFGYWAFGKHSAAADITESLSEDQVPEAFLVMLLIQFATMVVDRAIYLRKTMFGKCVFQVILVFGIHFWMFFILPGVTERRFNRNQVAQLWYFMKCIYFGLSAYQIKCGYPNRVLGNFLTKNYNYVNLFLFQGFRLIPFLTELRAVMDWVWTDTTLSLSSWICVEDIYADIFIMKCWRESEKPLFTMSAQQQNLVPYSQAAYHHMTNQFAIHSSAMQFIVNYMPEDIVVAKIKSDASLLWTISPASRNAMTEELSNSTHIYIHFYWTILRDASLVENAEISGKHTVCYEDKGVRDQLVQMLKGIRKEPVVLSNLVPRYLRAPSGPETRLARRLNVEHSNRLEDIEKLAFFRNITVKLKQAHRNSSDQVTKWWVICEWCPGCSEDSCKNIELVIFSDKVSPSELGFLAGYGIVGLYMSVVLVIGKFVRDFFNGISHSIMFEELPNVDRVLKLCTDIFLVRETGELELEEQLFAKLVFLYRSPETIIKWTREKQE
nr:PREDICTED: piezo-type mechanosensitive ion channel component 2-like [Latimeria chalumnae]|eukprot:XP_014342463.1 PREDICTED: piezo-type mechanosensitive ion channel component 2-like [Latimeria chalumnae]